MEINVKNLSLKVKQKLFDYQFSSDFDSNTPLTFTIFLVIYKHKWDIELEYAILVAQPIHKYYTSIDLVLKDYKDTENHENISRKVAEKLIEQYQFNPVNPDTVNKSE